MNNYFLIAGALCFLLGFIHSILGEYLIFNSKRNKGNLVPTKVWHDLKERHLRIIWATWHLASFFGWCIGFIILKIALEQDKINTEVADFIIQPIIITMLSCAMLVLIGTKAKHPGWVVLLIITTLLWIG